MVVLYDEAKVREIHEYNVRKDALEEGVEKGRAEGMKKGRAEGRAEGRNEEREKGISAMVVALKAFAVAKDAVAEKLMQCYHLTPQAAEAKVEQYWD